MIRLLGAGLTAALSLAGPERATADSIHFDVSEAAVWAEPREDGTAVGIGPAWAKLLLDRARLQAEVRALPYAELLAPSHRADRDFMIVVGARDIPMNGITVLSQLMEISIVVVPKRGLTLHDRRDLAGLSGIAVARGTPLAERLGLSGYALEPVPSMEHGLRMLSAGHVDAVAGTSLGIEVLAARMGLTDQLGPAFELSKNSVDLVVESARADGPEAASLREAAEAIGRESGFVRIVDAALRASPGTRPER